MEEIERGRVHGTCSSYLGEGDVQGEVESEDNSGNQHNENRECCVFKICNTRNIQ